MGRTRNLFLLAIVLLGFAGAALAGGFGSAQGGGGGGPLSTGDLAEVLGIANTSEGADIVLTAGDVLDASASGAATAISTGRGARPTPAVAIGDTNTGIFSPAAGQLEAVISGVRGWVLTATVFRLGRMLVCPAGDSARFEDDAKMLWGTGDDVFQQGELTTLGAETAVTVFSVVTANGDMVGVKIDFTIEADDATEFQTETGTVHISIIDDAGGVVASTPNVVSVNIESSGTLTPGVWTVVTTDDQSIEIQVASVSSLTQTTHQIRWFATVGGDVNLTVP